MNRRSKFWPGHPTVCHQTSTSGKLVQESLSSSAIMMDFWIFNNEIEESGRIPSTRCYAETFCRIEKSFNRLGPWATLIGNSMLKGLITFSGNKNLKAGLRDKKVKTCDDSHRLKFCQFSF